MANESNGASVADTYDGWVNPAFGDLGSADELRPDLEAGRSETVALFRSDGLEAVYVSAGAIEFLDPTRSIDLSEVRFGLRDIIGIPEMNRFESQVVPMLRLTGGWQGQLWLRDLWGSQRALRVTMRSVGEASLGREKLIVFRGSGPVEELFSSVGVTLSDREILLALLGSTQDAIYFKDVHSRFIRASRSLTQRFGLRNPHEVIGKTDFDFFDVAHALPAIQDERAILESGEGILDKVEKEVWPDGSVTWASTTKLPLRASNGQIVGTFGISRDITQRVVGEEQRKGLERQLQAAQRLEAVGSLAAGIAHEINTPTQFVSDNLRFLSDAFVGFSQVLRAYRSAVASASLPEAERTALAQAEQALEIDYLLDEVPVTLAQSSDGLRQIARIVGSMKEFSYQSGDAKAPADLNRAARNAVNVSRHEWKTLAKVEFRLDPELPKVSCFADQINQVLLNLVVNAAHAIEATEAIPGVIEITTYATDSDVVIEISDTGCGIPNSIRERVFEPFFTTKPVGKGTGQGLALSRNVVVNDHGGTLDFEPRKGGGTVFRISLPRDPRPQTKEESDESPVR